MKAKTRKSLKGGDIQSFLGDVFTKIKEQEFNSFGLQGNLIFEIL